ncbi:MAG: nuclear transport factor 2 family protein [Saprospiraceae bacterium]
MKKYTLLFTLLLPLAGTAQTEPALPARQLPQVHISPNTEHTARLKEINRDIWSPFSEAYAAYDAEKYLSLHTPDFIRANGGSRPSVNDLTGYRQSVTSGFERGKSSGRRVAIAFSFFERAAGEKTASERGIYRYTAIASDGGQQHYYGRFHVFHRKVEGTWKIAVDYDSNEDGTIGADNFEAGLPSDRFGCMGDALVLDDSLGRVRNRACEATSLSQTIRQYAAAIGQIGAGCPEAFAAGFKKHAAAWMALLPVTDRYPDLRGEMHGLFKQLESGKHGEAFKPLVKAVWDTWAEIEAAAGG